MDRDAFRDIPVSERPEFVEPSGSLSLRDALAAVLTNSPELAGYSWEVRAREAEALQAGLRPNPEIGAGIENFGGSGGAAGFGGSETTITLSQVVELGGKRGKRLAVAELDHNLAAWGYEIARIDVLTDATKAFLEVLAAQEQLVLAGEFVDVAAGVLASVSRRVEAGSTSPVEASRARVELETSRIDRDQARRSLAATRLRLSATWGGATPVFSEAEGDIEAYFAPPSLEELTAGLEDSPAVARWATEIDSRRATLDLERAMSTPDLSVGAGVRYIREGGDAALVVEFGLPLPLFDRNEGNTRAAAMRLRRAEEESRAGSLRVRTQMAILYEELLSAGTEVQALRERALPEARVAFESTRDAYLRGSLRFTDVLDTERMLSELKSRYFDALLRHHGTVAEMERLIGEPVVGARAK